MPTGYTAAIYEGKTITFSEFALNCSRAFGAAIMLRDASGDVLPTEDNVIDTSTYHVERLAEAEARLDALIEMPTAEAADAAEREHEQAIKNYRMTTGDYIGTKRRYETMLAQAKAWEPPTEDHIGLKEFMVEQLTTAMRFDCYQPDAPAPRCLSAAEWFHREMEKAQRDIDYHREEQGKLEERNASRAAYVRALRESLEGVPA